ncbi:MAG: hypothetical protein Q9201_005017 [Fulgogasparrea decipioides]
MHTSTLLVSSLVRSLTTAVPVASPPGGDLCGPTNQTPSDPPDTCNATPQHSTEPATFGISLIPRTRNYIEGLSWSVCTSAINQLCDQDLSNTALNAWHFALSETGQDILSCQVGFWLPGDPATPGAAKKPSAGQCKNIFNAIRTTCNDRRMSTGGTINLAVNPANQSSQRLSLPGGWGTGELAFDWILV